MKFGEIVLKEKKVDVSDIIKAIRMQKIRNAGTADQYVKSRWKGLIRSSVSSTILEIFLIP